MVQLWVRRNLEKFGRDQAINGFLNIPRGIYFSLNLFMRFERARLGGRKPRLRSPTDAEGYDAKNAHVVICN